MIEIWIPVAFVFGVIGSALLFRPIRVERDKVRKELTATTGNRDELKGELKTANSKITEMVEAVGGAAIEIADQKALIASTSDTIRDQEDLLTDAADQLSSTRTRNKDVETELERTSWSLGGRLRDKEQGAIYIMPPGQENEASCDEARLGWMDCADKAAKALRLAGMPGIADEIYPLNVPAEQFDAKTLKRPSVADARKLSP